MKETNFEEYCALWEEECENDEDWKTFTDEMKKAFLLGMYYMDLNDFIALAHKNIEERMMNENK